MTVALFCYEKVVIDPETNSISVWNNGRGIPVEMHKEEKCWVPELIFGHCKYMNRPATSMYVYTATTYVCTTTIHAAVVTRNFSKRSARFHAPLSLNFADSKIQLNIILIVYIYAWMYVFDLACSHPRLPLVHIRTKTTQKQNISQLVPARCTLWLELTAVLL
jgi:hypothetical protein